MRPKHLVALLIVLALAAVPAPAHAAGTVSVCDEAHLLAALADGGTVTFDCSGTIILTTTITISSDTTIDGTGHAVTISGGGAVRVFWVNEGVALELNNLTVADGKTTGFDNGAGIYNAGTLTVSNSTFSGNSGSWVGGGIYNWGTLTVSNSTFWGNSAPQGGGIASSGTLSVSNSTFSSNGAPSGGAGIFTYKSTATLENTIFANSTAGPNCLLLFGSVIDGGGNLSFPDTTCPGINSDPKLGPLQYNGGLTKTARLLQGSAALDAADDATCAAPPVNNLDQRGLRRPQGAHCDIGAYEGIPPTFLPFIRR